MKMLMDLPHAAPRHPTSLTGKVVDKIAKHLDVLN